MFRHKIYEDVKFKTYVDWFLLAFLAGSVNAGGFLACHSFITHVTGFGTLAGLTAISLNWRETLSILTVPVYFLIGVIVSAYFTDRRVHEGKPPRYAVVMGLVTLLLSLAGIGGFLGWYGRFGEAAEMQTDYYFLALLCAASGLQNAALTSSSGATIRTTHLTGITTDLGIGIVRVLTLRAGDPRRKSESKFNLLRLGTIGSFVFGSAAGAVLYLRLEYLGFVLPSLIAGYATFVATRDQEDNGDKIKKRSGETHSRSEGSTKAEFDNPSAGNNQLGTLPTEKSLSQDPHAS